MSSSTDTEEGEDSSLLEDDESFEEMAPNAPLTPALVRNASCKEREAFGDVESEDDKDLQPHVRRRRGSRSERNSHANAVANQNDDGTEDEDEEGGIRLRRRHSKKSNRSRASTSPRPKLASSLSEDHERRLAFIRQKLSAINACLEDAEGNAPGAAARLTPLAVSREGLLDDDVRQRAWPFMVSAAIEAEGGEEALPTQEECEKHKEYNQVVLDVDRSLKRFPPGIKDEERPGLQEQLTRLIVRVLIKHKTLHYYQGYHDVAITFLLVVGEVKGYHIMQRLSVTHLKDFMAPTMEKTTHLLNYMYPILHRENTELYDFMESSEVGTIFALPWLITWFGHVLSEYTDVVRLYDFFLVKPPLMPVYLATAIVAHRSQEVLATGCDLASVHGLLSNIPVDLPIEKLLVDAQALYDKYPPETLTEEVTRRMAALQAQIEENRRRYAAAKTAKEREALKGIATGWGDSKNALGLTPVQLTIGAGALLISAPIAIGYLAYKFFNGSS